MDLLLVENMCSNQSPTPHEPLWTKSEIDVSSKSHPMRTSVELLLVEIMHSIQSPTPHEPLWTKSEIDESSESHPMRTSAVCLPKLGSALP